MNFLLLGLLATSIVAIEDDAFLLRPTSQRGGVGKADVLLQGEEMETQIRKVLSRDTARAVIYLDALWSIDSKRGAFDSLLEVSAHLEEYNVPVLVLNQNSWWPASSTFDSWWTLQNVSFSGTKYRAILLFVVEGQLKRGFMNFLAGEGGSECVAAVGLRALNLPDDKFASDPGISRYCDAFADHSRRESLVWMGPSPRGWRPQFSHNVTKELYELPTAFSSFGVDTTCLWPWALVPHSHMLRSIALQGARAWVVDFWPESNSAATDSSRASRARVEVASPSASPPLAGVSTISTWLNMLSSLLGLSDATIQGTGNNAEKQNEVNVHENKNATCLSETLMIWIDAYDGPEKRHHKAALTERLVSEHLRRAASVMAALQRRSSALRWSGNACPETSWGQPTYACECSRELWDGLGGDDDAFQALFNIEFSLRSGS